MPCCPADVRCADLGIDGVLEELDDSGSRKKFLRLYKPLLAAFLPLP